MFRKLNTEGLEKVSGGEIFKMITTEKFVEWFTKSNKDSNGTWHPCVSPQIIKCCSIYYLVGSNPDSLCCINEKKYCFYTLAEAEQFARSRGYSTNVIDVMNEVNF